MSEALQTDRLPPEAVNFLKAGTMKPTGEKRSPIEVGNEGNIATPAAATASSPSEVVLRKPAHEKPVQPVLAATLVSMTFRLPSEILSGLIRASADRKLTRESPCTQQEIVAEALAQWLNRNGY